ncbi:hypothetical protein TTHERM_00482380 (macronuclear) [Tetrahymena thermophila SB210]|uniref:Uncharacterized protein n=1 Tax=Tetrahymena thermophila (strain SB210) TaxID=312017 RepID=I7MJU5_TETTS|nr:hypothetical protein TTHERM_00482380 [Tetrahymena thermophila SB210]EAR97205.2 hypothetical protein TTHERM_00482380 [Tetrahymena thermophila SB210]|eukprot:XP_001017450.2 hypothetical protein TTHERM_00482380 [Tetrahymena thermophila SB210]
MINDQAKKLLDFNNPSDFKVFSRKSIIYNRIEESQKDQKQKNTLENKIIQIFKNSLSNNQKDIKNSNLLKEKLSQLQQRGLSFDANMDAANNYLEGSFFYALYQKSEGQTQQKLSIKASTFQNQTDFYCCLVIEEVINFKMLFKIQTIKLLSKQAREKVKSNFLKNMNEFDQIIINNLDIYSNGQLLNQQKIKQIQIQEEDSKSSFNNQQSNSSNDFDEFYLQDKVLDLNQIKIQFELLFGEQEVSNIIKITVKDHGIGMSLDKILKMLEILNTKNIDFSSQYLNNSFLGWKVNYHIIGNLGPFYNFFIQSQENQGLEYHFYIFQDIKILKESNLQQKMVFKNHQFDISLQQSNKNFYNIHRIDELQDQENISLVY